MIISKKKYLENIKAAANEAEARTAFRMHENQRREEEERRVAEQFRELRLAHDRDMQDLYRQLGMMNERLTKLEGKDERL